MPRYNHACTVAFEVLSDDEDGGDITPSMLHDALLRRIRDLETSTPDKREWLEACLPPYDTFDTSEDV